MSMMKSTSLTIAMLLVVGATGWTWGDEPSKAARPNTSLTVRVLFARYQGDKKVSNMPYTLPVEAVEEGAPPIARASLRVGLQVPVTASSGDDKGGTVVYKDVGTNLDCQAQALGGGRFRLSLSLDQGSVYAADPTSKGATELAAFHAPVLRNFRSQAVLILRDGQTAQYVVAADPVSGELLKIDVTLDVVK